MVTKSSLPFKFDYTSVSCRVYFVLGTLVNNKNNFRGEDLFKGHLKMSALSKFGMQKLKRTNQKNCS